MYYVNLPAMDIGTIPDLRRISRRGQEVSSAYWPITRSGSSVGSLEGRVFEMYRNPETNLVNIGHILAVMERTGVRREDVRLGKMMTALTDHHRQHGEENTTVDNLNLNQQDFKK